MKNLLDLHTHSVLSLHAYSSTTENIDVAISKGLKYMGVSEHQPDSKGVGAHIYGINNGVTIPRHIGDLTVLYGVECNLLNDGTIDDSRFKWSHFDYAICSIHAYVYDDAGYEGNTSNLLKVMDHPHIKIMGHLDRGFYPMDYDAIIKKAKERHILIEINESSLNGSKYDFDRTISIMNEMLDKCKKYDVPVIINSDAHIKYEIGTYEKALKVIENANFPLDKVLNFNEDLFKEYFKID